MPFMPPVNATPSASQNASSYFPPWPPKDRNSNSQASTPTQRDSPAISPGGPVYPKRWRQSTVRSTSYSSTRSSNEIVRLRTLPAHLQTPQTDQRQSTSDDLQRAQTIQNGQDSRPRRASSISGYARKVFGRPTFGSSFIVSPQTLDKSPTVDRAESRRTSEDSWVERLRAKHRVMRSARITPISNTVTGLMEGNKGQVPQKLRPPVSRNISASMQHHTVNIETDFAETETEISQPEERKEGRHASIHGRSAYEKSKRIVQDQYGRLRKSSVDQAEKPRDRTDEALYSVAGTLSQLIEERPQRRTKNVRFGFFGSPPSNDAEPFQFDFERQRPKSDISVTSSINELRRGVVPTGSPNPGATYRARLRPDGPSEEFLKIDISEPGGTSYLPSEARRIHTPPLPGEGPNHKRRGFFFDYNPPQPDDGGALSRESSGSPTAGMGSPGRRESSAISHPATIGTTHGPGKRKKAGNSDLGWYTAQLDELDREDADLRRLQDRRRSKSPGSNRSRKQSRSSERGRKSPGVEVDYRIPDHYPSSPLCPRHPKHKSKGTGTCWMHGHNPPGWERTEVELRVGGTGSELYCYRSGRGDEVLCYRSESLKSK